jgi:hypothetical protein
MLPSHSIIKVDGVKDWCSNQLEVYLSKDFRPLAPKFGGTRNSTLLKVPQYWGTKGAIL